MSPLHNSATLSSLPSAHLGYSPLFWWLHFTTLHHPIDFPSLAFFINCGPCWRSFHCLLFVNMANTVTDSMFDHSYYSWTSPKNTTTSTTKFNQNNGANSCPKQVAKIPKLPDYVKSCSQLLSSIGFMSINDNVYNQLRSLYPLVSINETTQSKCNLRERKLANLYKCDVYHHDCYFTTDSENEFRKHLDEGHAKQSLYCFYCTKSNHHENCSSTGVKHCLFGQSADLVCTQLIDWFV